MEFSILHLPQDDIASARTHLECFGILCIDKIMCITAAALHFEENGQGEQEGIDHSGERIARHRHDESVTHDTHHGRPARFDIDTVKKRLESVLDESLFEKIGIPHGDTASRDDDIVTFELADKRHRMVQVIGNGACIGRYKTVFFQKGRDGKSIGIVDLIFTGLLPGLSDLISCGEDSDLQLFMDLCCHDPLCREQGDVCRGDELPFAEEYISLSLLFSFGPEGIALPDIFRNGHFCLRNTGTVLDGNDGVRIRRDLCSGHDLVALTFIKLCLRSVSCKDGRLYLECLASFCILEGKSVHSGVVERGEVLLHDDIFCQYTIEQCIDEYGLCGLYGLTCLLCTLSCIFEGQYIQFGHFLFLSFL